MQENLFKHYCKIKGISLKLAMLKSLFVLGLNILVILSFLVNRLDFPKDAALKLFHLTRRDSISSHNAKILRLGSVPLMG